jgi:hypothetical protein
LVHEEHVVDYIHQCLNLDLDYSLAHEDLLDELVECIHLGLNLFRHLDCNLVHEGLIHQLMILDLMAEKDELVECIHQRLNLSLRHLGYSLVHEENLKSLHQLKVKMVC